MGVKKSLGTSGVGAVGRFVVKEAATDVEVASVFVAGIEVEQRGQASDVRIVGESILAKGREEL